ncbi:DUF2141 domain-containing protein [Hymenobacter weizhouensis]|uniref:DUF2141 domain-containing protein n=1 Tax=Hymenobacter sp. YIM 151500-1 TaxID=2987689 RepID=UPI0022271ABC|nr:DUF2141 domain-containing protein [Hymenobacter sp. YIM 151500-1]UYZ62523.1 DUF2141 domain-containing protein [Hymenobacter sp. YIM 151500-1]
MVFILLPLAMALSAPESLSQQSALRIEIVNIQKNKGKVIVAIYKDKSGWLQNPYKTMIITADENSKTASFNVPYGKYAVSIFQDINNNDKLDQNFLGIPKEPIGFGNNYKPLGMPNFESAVVEHSLASKPAAIKLASIF